MRLAIFNHHLPRWQGTLMGCFISSNSWILSAFCHCQRAGKKQESKALPFEGSSNFLNPLSTSVILFQTQKKCARWESQSVTLHPSTCAASTYSVAPVCMLGVLEGIQSLLPGSTNEMEQTPWCQRDTEAQRCKVTFHSDRLG